MAWMFDAATRSAQICRRVFDFSRPIHGARSLFAFPLACDRVWWTVSVIGLIRWCRCRPTIFPWSRLNRYPLEAYRHRLCVARKLRLPKCWSEIIEYNRWKLLKLCWTIISATLVGVQFGITSSYVLVIGKEWSLSFDVESESELFILFSMFVHWN